MTVIEGTLAEVQQQLSALPLMPEDRIRIQIEELGGVTEPVQSFTPTEYRNGVPLLPRRNLKEPVTLELIQQIQEKLDEEENEPYLQRHTCHPGHCYNEINCCFAVPASCSHTGSLMVRVRSQSSSL